MPISTFFLIIPLTILQKLPIVPSVDCIGMQTLLWAIQGFCQTAIQASKKTLNISKPTEAIPNWAHSKIPELHVIYFYKYIFFIGVGID